MAGTRGLARLTPVDLLRFAIVGFGNVGAALARHVHERSERVGRRYGIDLRLVAVADSTGFLNDTAGLDGNELAAWRESGRRLAERSGAHRHCQLEDVLAAGVDVVVISLPTDRDTGKPGLNVARASIAAGAHVVLADKGPALLALPELEREAALRGVTVGASATVGAALPTLSVARRELAGAELLEIEAILNGTSNLILTSMRERGISFHEAVAEAQRAGIAEPDPSYDVQGWDTAVKLTILTRALIDERATLNLVGRTGIDELEPDFVEWAHRTGGRIRLIGRAVRRNGGAVVTVAPEVVPPHNPFHLVDGARKAIRFVTDDLGELVVTGGASGRRDVAAALLRDILATKCQSGVWKG